MTTVGQRLRLARDARNLTRNQVYAKIELSPTTLGSWERDQNTPDGPVVALLAVLYGVTTDWIWGVTEAAGGPDLNAVVDDAVRAAERDDARDTRSSKRRGRRSP